MSPDRGHSDSAHTRIHPYESVSNAAAKPSRVTTVQFDLHVTRIWRRAETLLDSEHHVAPLA
ncbi:hypothetical protein EES45_01520 [Streptomyces sp. ADI97-07]|nr:hypothetical protein EES45_01520 [Streptomyces sp. ADI97-07]